MGDALAQEIVSFLGSEGPISITIDPREGEYRAFWRRAGGSYAYGERSVQGHESPFKVFPSREELLRWLAASSDEDFAKMHAPDDPRRWGLHTFSRAGFLRELAQRKR